MRQVRPEVEALTEGHVVRLKKLARDERIATFLEKSRTPLIRPFVEADLRAGGLQKGHKQLSFWVILLGGIATALGVLHLAWPKHWITVIESGLFGVAAILVLVGILGKRHHRWLAARFEAERLRLLLFELVADPDLWTSDLARRDWQGYFEKTLRDQTPVNEDNLMTVAANETPPSIWRSDDCKGPEVGHLKALVSFWDGHVRGQMQYFDVKIEQEKTHRILDNENLGGIVFAVIALLIALHVAFEFTGKDRLATAFLAGSLAVAAIWAAIRTWRSANEYSRNARRAEAKRDAIHAHSKALEAELQRPEPDRAFVFNTLSACAALLRADQREWLALMVEAEWYG